MKKTFVLTTIVVLLVACISSFHYPMKNFTIRGIVKDSLGNFVPDINIIIYSNKDKFASIATISKEVGTTTTDNIGRFKHTFEDDNGPCLKAVYDLVLYPMSNSNYFSLKSISPTCVDDYERDYEITVVKR